MVVSSLELLLARACQVLQRSITRAAAHASERTDSPVRLSGRPGHETRLSGRSAAVLMCSALADYARAAAERFQRETPWCLAFREAPRLFVANTLAYSSRGLRLMLPPQGRFYADPCVFSHDGVDHVFFEDFDQRAGKGVISWMRRASPGTFTAPELVLDRPHHLAYPFVFAHDTDVYMVPETSAVRQVQLFRAVDFPRRWEPVAVLLDDVVAADATLIEHGGWWWMFTAIAEVGSSACDELFIYYARSPLGPWRPHQANPVKSDVRSARPAGRLFRHRGRLIRPAQNCARVYGGSVVLCEVLELTTDAYRERVLVDLGANRTGGTTRCHTVSSSDRLEFLDASLVAGLPADRGD
jgi:hypothetical protein